MLYTLLTASLFVAAANAGTIEISSSDLSAGDKRWGIKGSWSQDVKVFGNAATIDAAYDRAEKKDFLKEMSLKGSLDKVKYELSTRFAGETGLKFSTATDDGTDLELDSEIKDLKMTVKSVSAARKTSMRGQDYDLKLEHDLGPNESKLSLSTLLGSGVRATGVLSAKDGSADKSYSFEYDTQLTSGRSLHAEVSPSDGSGEIEYVDTATIDGTITGTIPLGGKPTISVKRAFNF